MTITDEGVRVSCKQKEILPFTKWSSFGAVYFFAIDYEVRGVTLGGNRSVLKYLLLTERPIPEEEMRRRAIKLSRKAPYAVFGTDIVLRAEGKEVDLFQKHMGDRLGIEKRDFVVNLRDKA